ncbi:hypothetical protein A5707_19455 [Mycobacterium kyorinense]|uniref:S-adenosyl-L-methionine-dependent methyltransferase n=1 Tax=Mycobacterium kyorinense TaxID=487514 RepID=A0A1A2ZCR1_9MYCO|nr:SAM-dependent methyltransferase [Mycobacterium kyorinense]OBI47458.1 hypothetical protein A5707_19455 [Mycobacterium kyorinense]
MTRTDNDGGDIADNVGATALGGAITRAAESQRDCPLFTDPYAQFFLDAATARGWRAPSPGPGADYTAVRTKWFDEQFIAAGANGIEQTVILAAGLDARAWRLPWVQGSVVYEIDQPSVLEFKADTLAAHGARPAVTYHAVPVDVRQDWPKALRQAGFDRVAPTLCVVEGLLSHLPAAEQELLVQRITDLSASSSRVAVEGHGDVATWLTHRDWAVETTEALDLMERYGRSPSGEEANATPRSLLIDARLAG